MLKLVTFLIIGAIFGVGILISGMANPAKVLNFFDFFGPWDPSLIYVMGGALTTTAIGYRIIFNRQSKPLLADGFLVPSKRSIDVRLVAGSATFGIGWGIAGICPGGAIPALGLGSNEIIIFVTAMLIGILLARTVSNALTKTALT